MIKQPSKLRGRLILAAGLILSGLLISGCGIGYIARGAFQGAKLLSARMPIELVIDDPKTPPQLKKRLELARSVLQYADTIGLSPKGAYSSFVKVDSGALSWILMASKTTSFELKTWWFPIVGTVPYKGYFSKEDAITAGRDLRAHGYEGLVRPTAAFSTLGWFKDPILSTFTDGDEIHLINTLLHELVHRHIWIPNDATANESLANFIGTEATVDFLAKQTPPPPDWSSSELERLLARARSSRDSMYKFAAAIDELYQALNRIYESSLTDSEKLELKQVAFKRLSPRTLKLLQNTGGFKDVNNAELMQHRIYHVGLNELRRSLNIVGRDWPAFITLFKSQLEKRQPQKLFKPDN